MSAAENTPSARQIHQNLDAQARYCDAGLALDGSAARREQIARTGVTTPMHVSALPKVSTLPRVTTCAQSPIGCR
jgi:hypothetical protein